MPRRARPPKAVLAQREAILPPEEAEARQALWQSFVDGTWLRGVASFEKRVAQFRAQEFARGIGRERAVEIVRECDRRYVLETAEVGAGAKDAAVRAIKDAQQRALAEYAGAKRYVFVRGAKGVVTREELPDHRARLRALELWSDLHVKLCRLLGVDQPIRVLDETPRGFDENLVRAAQETSDEDFTALAGEERPAVSRPASGQNGVKGGTVH